MRTVPFLALASIALVSGCTSIPDGYTADTSDPANCGYRVEQTQRPGFALEVYFKEYKFLPSAEQPVQGAKQCFIRTAQRLAKQQGKILKPILMGDINAAPTRNTLDGTYSVFATGRVEYQE